MKLPALTACFAPSAVAAALALALPAAAQSNAELLEEMRALKNRVAELEKKLEAAPRAPTAPVAPAAAAAATQPGQWGMTPEQAAEFNRVAIKTEALQDNLEDQGFKGLTVSGYMEPSYIWNQRQDRAGFQFLNSQSDGYFYDTSFFGAAAIAFRKEMDGGTIWKLTLMPNRGSGAVIDGYSIVHEASVSVPLSDLQTRMIVGQVPDWSGYEYLEPTLSPFITRNLLFDFTLPVSYTGAGIDITSGKWWLRAMLANVNEAVRQQDETAGALAVRLDYARGEFSGWGVAGLVGKTINYNICKNDECDKFGSSNSAQIEVDGWYTRGDLTLGGQIGYGWQKRGAIIPDADENLRDAEWWGVSGLAGWNFTPRLQGLVRGDYIYNRKNGGGLFTFTGYWPDAGVDGAYGDHRNGIGPAGDLGCDADVTIDGCNSGANRYALSFGLKYLLNANTTLKAEYRLDGADRAVFYDVGSATFKKTNNLLGAAVLVSF